MELKPVWKTGNISHTRAIGGPSQPGEEELRWFSHDPAVHIPRAQMDCHMTRTTAATHELIRANLHETPTYGGWVEAKVYAQI